MSVTTNTPERFVAVGISHRFVAEITDMEQGKGPQVMFNVMPFGTALMPTTDLRALATWIDNYAPLVSAAPTGSAS